jgi:hypothetical protein
MVNNMFRSFFKETGFFLIILSIVSAGLGGYAYHTYIDTQKISHGDRITWFDEEVEEKHLTLKKISDTLYSLTGSVGTDDCKDIVPQLPTNTPFALILESPGGVLAEGACLASHIKLRNVITIVRDTPVLDENGDIMYTPGLVYEKSQEALGKEVDDPRIVCASACSLMFIAGDVRYLIGDVWLGIHGPRTPEESLGMIGKRALEASAYRTAGSLLKLLDHLGVTNKEVQRAFIIIPGTSMYWLSPLDWKAAPALRELATHYRDFWDYTGESVMSGLER